MVINDLNRGVLSRKNANIVTGSFGAYLILTTWGTNVVERNNMIASGNGGLNLDANLGALLSLIMAANGNGGQGMSPLFLHLGGNRSQQNPPTINTALPPIIEKNVDRTGTSNPTLAAPTRLGIGEGFKPYQPNFQNIQQADQSPPPSPKIELKQGSLRVAGEKPKPTSPLEESAQNIEVQINDDAPLETMQSGDNNVDLDEIHDEDLVNGEESELDWSESGDNNA